MKQFFLNSGALRKSFFTSVAVCAVAFACACNPPDSTSPDTFVELRYDYLYDLKADKSLNVGSFLASSGQDCVAVMWEGNFNGSNYFGFGGRDKANKKFFMLWFVKPATFANDGTLFYVPAGSYWATMREGDNVYNLGTPVELEITITPNPDPLKRVTEIKSNTKLDFTAVNSSATYSVNNFTVNAVGY